MKNITKKEIEKYLSYDEITGSFIWKHRSLEEFKSTSAFKSFQKRFKGKVAGTIKECGGGKPYIVIVVNYVKYKAHHLAWICTHNTTTKHQIDHIDGNSLNNKIKNLRVVTQAENNKNKRLDKRSKTGITGVYFIGKSALWGARICSDGEQEHLGIFSTLLEACCHRKSAELRLGFHANHGKPKPV